jgi:streptogramin lyase
VAVIVDREGFLGDGEPLPDNVAVGEGYVWAGDDHGRGLRIDPATGEVTRFEVEGGFAWPFLATAGHVWFGRSAIRLVDAQTLEVVDVVDGDSENVESAFDRATATLWVANYKGTVTRVEWR